MSYDRSLRIAQVIKKVVSHLIQFEIKDPRLSAMTSVMKVEVTSDYSFATIYVSILDDEEAKKSSIVALNKAKGFIKRAVAKELKLRVTPDLIFKLDDSLEYSANFNKLLDDVISKDNEISAKREEYEASLGLNVEDADNAEEAVDVQHVGDAQDVKAE